jgi:hypothetical protein
LFEPNLCQIFGRNLALILARSNFCQIEQKLLLIYQALPNREKNYFTIFANIGAFFARKIMRISPAISAVKIHSGRGFARFEQNSPKKNYCVASTQTNEDNFYFPHMKYEKYWLGTCNFFLL